MKDIDIIREKYIEKRAPLKAAEILEMGISYQRILEFEKDNILIRYKSGYYTVNETTFDEEEIIKGLFSDAVFTMETGLYYHGYIKKRPSEWSLAVSKNISKSRVKTEYPIIIPYYTEPHVLYDGAIEKETSSGPVRVYSIERLVCDILKYEKKLSHKDFQAAIKGYIKDPDKNIDMLMSYAKSRKVQKKVEHLIIPWLTDSRNVIKPEIIKKTQDISQNTNEKCPEIKIIECKTENDVAEILYNILETETLAMNNMISLYLAGTTLSLNGRKIWTALYDACEKSGISIKKEIITGLFNSIEEIDINSLDEIKRHKDMSFDPIKTPKIIKLFVLPIFEALISNTVFFGDWIPELERYL